MPPAAQGTEILNSRSALVRRMIKRRMEPFSYEESLVNCYLKHKFYLYLRQVSVRKPRPYRGIVFTRDLSKNVSSRDSLTIDLVAIHLIFA